jgi:hypothetical protein
MTAANSTDDHQESALELSLPPPVGLLRWPPAIVAALTLTVAVAVCEKNDDMRVCRARTRFPSDNAPAPWNFFFFNDTP